MKKFIFIIIVVFSSHFCDLFSWDTTAAKYMPLQVGNTWVYYDHYTAPYPNPSSSSLIKYKITGTEDTLGKRYFVFQQTIVPIVNGYVCGVPYLTRLRIDSSKMILYNAVQWCNSSEYFVDSLSSRKNDLAYVCPQVDYHVCVDTSLYAIFNDSFPSKRFQGYHNPFTVYVKGIGIVSFGWGELMNTCSDILVGCVINGILRGDTSMIVGTNQISTEVPKAFSLYQNYPNPFNPTTKIKFDIPNVKRETSNVKLVVYDALGKEVAILVNEQLKPGTYEVDWDGTSYTSGVYFYKLEARDFQLSKKMILIK